MNFELYNHSAVYALVRIILGILFVFQGFDKVVNIKMKNVVAAYELPISYPFPNFMVWAGTVYTSYAELIGGAFLLVGLFTNYAFYALGLDLILAIVALSAMNPIWDMKFVWPRLVLLVTLCIMPSNWNMFSLDYLFFNR